MQRPDDEDSSDSDAGVYGRTVVLDNGSATLRAGFYDKDKPSVIMPSIIGRPKTPDVTTTTPGNSNAADKAAKNEMFFGDEAKAKRGILKLSYPVCWGLVQDWEGLPMLWEHVFEEELECKTKNSPLLIMESSYMTPKRNRELVTHLTFETLNVPAFYLAPSPPAVLKSLGRKTGVVIDVARDNIRIVPVYEGYCMPHAIMKFEVGSQNITDRLNQLLVEKGFSLLPCWAKEAQVMKEKLAYVAQDFQQEMETFSVSQEKTYELPDGNEVPVGRERFQCVEPLFQPSLMGMEMMGLAEHVVLTISKCDLEIRQPLLSNVVLVGGGSMLSGFATRLQHDVEKELRRQGQPGLCELHVQMLAPPGGDLMVWQAGSHLARSPEFPKMCIFKEEYDENGPTIVHRKCF